MKALYDSLSYELSKKTTQKYSTSFSLAVRMLSREIHDGIYGIYGWVRLADEIVDTFLDSNRAELLDEFIKETHAAVDRGLSTNPIIHAFQQVVNEYGIEKELYVTFLRSMKMDLKDRTYDQDTYEEYILGSAQVVGLMCLRVFVEKDDKLYEELKEPAMALGAAFQKVNFLRDLREDYHDLGRVYFPKVNFQNFSEEDKREIQEDIKKDFEEALVGIKKLPRCCRFGVYSAYVYYNSLFRNIKRTAPERIMETRIRVPNWKKFCLTALSYGRISMNML